MVIVVSGLEEAYEKDLDGETITLFQVVDNLVLA
jgi:hypothetical protein